MKKRYWACLLVLLMLSGCSAGKTADTATDSAENTTVAVTEESLDDEFPEEDAQRAIVYEGVCYYGLAYYGEEQSLPDDAEKIGTAAASSTCESVTTNGSNAVPTEELQTNCGDPDTDIYATFDADGAVKEFYTATDGELGRWYFTIADLTTEKPSYYQET